MELALTEEQTLLRESVRRYLEADYTFAARNALLATEARTSDVHWARFAELGWLAASLPEAHGGLGGGAVETMVVCEGLGRAMVLEPYVSTVVLCGHALALAESTELTTELLPRIAAGDLKMALAFAEREGRYDLHHVETRASPAGNAFRLSGAKIAVLDAPSAEKLVVAARVEGETRDETGVALFVVDREAPGLRLEAYELMDGTRAADLVLDAVPSTLLVSAPRGLAVLEQAVERGIAARSAQAVGSMDASFEQTLEYVKTRQQFGAPLGSFQVLQHRLVDMYMAVRECQSMVLMLAQQVMGSDPGERRRAVAGAKAFVGKRARRVAQEVVQLHGGVGMTEELAIGHYFRALTLYTSLFGSTEHHLARYAELTLTG